MKLVYRLFLLFAALALGQYSMAQTRSIGIYTKLIEDIAGVTGTVNTEERVFKITFPRTDVPVEVDGWKMKPFMGLTSWAAFRKGVEKESIVMGDLVLFEDEVNPVMSIALKTAFLLLPCTTISSLISHESILCISAVKAALKHLPREFARHRTGSRHSDWRIPYRSKDFLTN